MGTLHKLTFAAAVASALGAPALAGTTSGDPCASFGGTDYVNCTYSLSLCQNMSGPVLQTCLAHAVQQAAGSTLTRTSTSTTSATRATTYAASKLNDGLFGDQANNANQTGDYTVQVNGNSVQTSETTGSGTFLNQNDAFSAQNAVMVGCAGTNLSGRTDALCAATPNDPECTGMSSSLGNATTCAVPGPPDSKGNPTCLSYGSYGYSLDEWLVFSQQYYNGMTSCFQVGSTADSTGASVDPNRMVNRADRLQALNDFVALPTTGALGSGSPDRISQVTGQSVESQVSSKGKPQSVPFWQGISAKFDDGAAALGFDRGELVRRSVTGESFSSAFSESPFGAALSKGMRETVEVALGDPAATMEKIRERNEAVAAAAAPAGDSPASPEGSARKTASPGAETAASPSPVRAAAGTVSPAGRATLSLRAPASSASSSASAGPVLTERERAYERAGLGGSARAGAMAGKPAGAVESSAAPAEDETLFRRVSLGYRRHAGDLKEYDDSKTARDVRNTEAPAFFRDL